MSKQRKEKDLILILKKLAEKQSFKLNYVFSNLDKMNNLYNLRLTEAEKKLIIKYRNKHSVNLKNPFSTKLKM